MLSGGTYFSTTLFSLIHCSANPSCFNTSKSNVCLLSSVKLLCFFFSFTTTQIVPLKESWGGCGAHLGFFFYYKSQTYFAHFSMLRKRNLLFFSYKFINDRRDSLVLVIQLAVTIILVNFCNVYQKIQKYCSFLNQWDVISKYSS